MSPSSGQTMRLRNSAPSRAVIAKKTTAVRQAVTGRKGTAGAGEGLVNAADTAAKGVGGERGGGNGQIGESAARFDLDQSDPP